MNLTHDGFGTNDITVGAVHGFVQHLRDRLEIDATAKLSGMEAGGQRLSIRSIWEACDLSADEFAGQVAAFFKYPRMSLPDLLAAPTLADRFTRRFLREAMMYPFDAGEGRFGLAVADPTDLGAQRGAQIVLGGPLTVAVASFEDVEAVLSERLGLEEEGLSASVPAQAPGAVEESIDSLRDLASGAPVVRAVNDLLEKAIDLRASDIHIEPMRNGLNVRMRVDGLLRAVPAPARALPQALISRVKILAGLNIAERRLPQDGAARLEIAHHNIDIRVATMPTQHGESAVIRLLARDRGLLDIPKLGLRAHDERKVKRFIDLPHGMIVITGPTGSGKTTTLATMLSVLNTPFRKILTIEDPVEYEIAGVNQSQVKPAIGLTFAAALRAFVRQDPDVIMVGGDSRRRDGQHRNPRRVDWASGSDDAPYRNGGRRSAAPSRPGRRGLPAEIDASGRHRAAARPHIVRSLQIAKTARDSRFRRRPALRDVRSLSRRVCLGAAGLRAVRGNWLSRARRRV